MGGDYWVDGDPGRTNNDTIDHFNAGLEQLVAYAKNSGRVTLVDSGVSQSDLADGVP